MDPTESISLILKTVSLSGNSLSDLSSPSPLTKPSQAPLMNSLSISPLACCSPPLYSSCNTDEPSLSPLRRHIWAISPLSDPFRNPLASLGPYQTTHSLFPAPSAGIAVCLQLYTTSVHHVSALLGSHTQYRLCKTVFQTLSHTFSLVSLHCSRCCCFYYSVSVLGILKAQLSPVKWLKQTGLVAKEHLEVHQWFVCLFVCLFIFVVCLFVCLFVCLWHVPLQGLASMQGNHKNLTPSELESLSQYYADPRTPGNVLWVQFEQAIESGMWFPDTQIHFQQIILPFQFSSTHDPLPSSCISSLAQLWLSETLRRNPIFGWNRTTT